MSVLSSITNLIPGVTEIKTAFVIVISVFGLLGTGYVIYEIHESLSLKQDNTTLTQNINVLKKNATVLQSNFAQCQTANTNDQKTITELTAERQQAQQALAALAAKNQSDTKTLTALQQKLTEMEKDPKNDGTISQDLAQAIAGIQGTQ